MPPAKKWNARSANSTAAPGSTATPASARRTIQHTRYQSSRIAQQGTGNAIQRTAYVCAGDNCGGAGAVGCDSAASREMRGQSPTRSVILRLSLGLIIRVGRLLWSGAYAT